MGKDLILSIVLAMGLGAAGAAAADPADKIVYGVPKPAPLVAQWSSTNVLIGGAIGGLLSLADGKQMVEKYEIADPAETMSPILAARLAARTGYTLGDAPIVQDPKTKDPAGLLARQGRYAVGVGTVQRRFIWYPTNWTHYSIIYWSRFYVVDTKARRIVVQDLCKWTSPREGAPTRDELMADDARRLKAAFADGQAACLARFEGVADGVVLDPPSARPAPVDAPTAVAMRSAPETTLPPRVQAPPPVDMVAIAATGATALGATAPRPPGIAPTVVRERTAPRAVEAPPLASPSTFEAPARPAFTASYSSPPASPAIEREPLPSRTEYRVAGRDEQGYLVWPGKRP